MHHHSHSLFGRNACLCVSVSVYVIPLHILLYVCVQPSRRFQSCARANPRCQTGKRRNGAKEDGTKVLRRLMEFDIQESMRARVRAVITRTLCLRALRRRCNAFKYDCTRRQRKETDTERETDRDREWIDFAQWDWSQHITYTGHGIEHADTQRHMPRLNRFG